MDAGVPSTGGEPLLYSLLLVSCGVSSGPGESMRLRDSEWPDWRIRLLVSELLLA